MKFVKPQRNFFTHGSENSRNYSNFRYSWIKVLKWCHNWLPFPSPLPLSLLLSDSGFLLCGFCFSDRFSPHEDSPAAPGLNVPPGCYLKDREVIILLLFTLNSSPEISSWPSLDYMTFPKRITVSGSYACCEEDVGSPVWWLCTGGNWEPVPYT